jgi:FkbM family methyltransferase
MSVEEKRIIFDIGANHGGETASSHLCSYHTKRPWTDHYRVICVEPNPELCDKLRKRFLDYNVEVISAAITNEDVQEIPFHVSRIDTLSTCLESRTREYRDVHGNNPYDNNFETIKVPAITIDKLVEDYGNPSFIKIDVEGYEHNVLRTFKKNYCPISFEWGESEKPNAKMSLQRCKELGYTKFWITFGNIGIHHSIQSLCKALYNCEYWRQQGNWMIDHRVLVWEPLTFAEAWDYINYTCTKGRLWIPSDEYLFERPRDIRQLRRHGETGQTAWAVDSLWGQIYAE